jgi:hypothetical protein
MPANWTTPRTWAVGELATAALMNQHVRDNLEFLKTPPFEIFNSTATVTINSAGFVDLWPTLTLTSSGGGFQITVLANCSSATANALVAFDLMLDNVSVTNLTNGLLETRLVTVNTTISLSFTYYLPPQPAGTHTFRLRMRTAAVAVNVLGPNNNVSGQFTVREI